MRLVLRIAAAMIGIALLSANPAAARAPRIGVTMSEAGEGVRIVYDLPEPVTSLAVRATNQEGPPPGTHIRVVEEGLAYRRGRIEGAAPFRRATLVIDTDDGAVDSRYPLLSPVAGRGHVLFAPYVLPDGPVDARIEAGGGRFRAPPPAELEGYVVVGAVPAPHGAFRALASANTPLALEARFHERAGALLDYYSRRLHRRLATTPTLIVSVVDGPADAQHRFFRGDVTPNGVVLLRYHGTIDQITDPNTTRQFTSFLAHELFHLWNRRRGNHPMTEAWLHEGSAEYFGWLAAATLWPGEVSVDDKIGQALSYCGAFLGTRALSRLETAEAMANRYNCGAVVNWIADLGARRASRSRRDGFDLWAGLVRDGDYSLADFAAGAGAAVEARPARGAMVRFPAARAIVLSACGAFWGAGDTGVEFYVSAPDDCAALSGQVTLLRVDGIDPMQAQPFHAHIRDRCAARQALPMTVRSNGATREVTVNCTVAVEDPYPDLHVSRALPISPRGRSSP